MKANIIPDMKASYIMTLHAMTATSRPPLKARQKEHDNTETYPQENNLRVSVAAVPGVVLTSPNV
jgi:hypothetical protein